MIVQSLASSTCGVDFGNMVEYLFPLTDLFFLYQLGAGAQVAKTGSVDAMVAVLGDWVQPSFSICKHCPSAVRGPLR